MDPESKKLVTSASIAAPFIPYFILLAVHSAAGSDTMLGLGILMLGTVLAVVVAWRVLRWQGSAWSEIGLAIPKSWPRTVLLGFSAFLGATVISALVLVVAENLGTEPIDQSRFDSVVGDVPYLMIGLLGGWTTISFGEEMLFRAFFISRVAGLFADPRFGSTFAVVAGAVLFGLTFLFAGPVVIVGNGIVGLLFGVIYLRTHNLWITIIAAGLFETIGSIIIFAGVAG